MGAARQATFSYTARPLPYTFLHCTRTAIHMRTNIQICTGTDADADTDTHRPTPTSVEIAAVAAVQHVQPVQYVLGGVTRGGAFEREDHRKGMSAYVCGEVKGIQRLAPYFFIPQTQGHPLATARHRGEDIVK